MNDPRHPVAPAPVAERVQALEGALSARQLVPDGFLDAAAAQAERELSPRNGAQVVARAWLDPAYRTPARGRHGRRRRAGLQRDEQQLPRRA